MQPLAAVIADAGLDTALSTPAPERCALDAERAGDLLGGLPAVLEQALFEALELVREAHPMNALRIERITSAGAQAALVEHVGGLCVGVLLPQRVDLSAHVLVGGALLLSRQPARQRQRGGGAAAASAPRR